MRKAQLIYEYIRDCILNHNFSPTVREICERVGIKSTSTVHYYLKELVDEGYIVKDDPEKAHHQAPRKLHLRRTAAGHRDGGMPHHRH